MLMKKLIIPCLAAAALASLSACSTVNDKEEATIPGTTNSPPQSLVPFPDTTISSTHPPQPNPPGPP
jgi:curli biogenesis system outer membrane secretion channel CsgG